MERRTPLTPDAGLTQTSAMRIQCLAFGCLLATLSLSLRAANETPHPFLSFVKRQAESLRSQDKAPTSSEAWEKQRTAIRTVLQDAWGEFPTQHAPLSARTLGTLQKEGYRIEKLIFQTFSNVWMTANAYVPNSPGPHPAILAVHGHWKGAKQDPVVQARCISSTRLGFFVLAVDAFGAGERGVSKALGEYHGEMTAATLLPLGRPLSGLQVYENLRAVDYLRSRPEVNPQQIGITGASGGGNQTMYAGAWDERLKSVVPVCSVGNYQAYLGAACCLCEVVPGILKTTEEWGVLGQIAPRGLLVINASRDAVQFSPSAASNSLTKVEPIYQLLGKPENLRHGVYESDHDYNSAMRQAMNGWMRWQLVGQGDGAPVPEPEIQTEDPESLRCFPGTSRPDDWITLPRFAQAEGRLLAARHITPSSPQAWKSASGKARQALLKRVLGDFPPLSTLALEQHRTADGKSRSLTFLSEPGISLQAHQEFGASNAPIALLLDLDGAAAASTNALAAELRTAGWSLITFDLRATGKQSLASDGIGNAPDHNSAEWSLWLGRPLLGQWTWDVRRVLDALLQADRRLPSKVAVIGCGPAGAVALCAAVLDPRVTHVSTHGSLASFITDRPYRGQRLGILAPSVLKEVGDIAHIAALAAPRRLVVGSGVYGGGGRVPPAEMQTLFQPTLSAYSLINAASRVSLLANEEAKALVIALADP